MSEETSLTPEEVAGVLKITKNTVYELIKRGELTAYRVGRKIRVDPADVEKYKTMGKNAKFPGKKTIPENRPVPRQGGKPAAEEKAQSREIIICGQDIILDILSHHLERHPNGTRALRSYVGSFNGLLSLYYDQAHMTATHLWDEETGMYNLPFIRRFLPGIPVLVIHLACRMQGFYVACGNPKGINSWHDLTRPDVCFVNREKGCGTRVLLDEQLWRLGIDRRMINGYEREENSHLAVASTVARGEADAGLGIEKPARQVREMEFIPLHKERYDMVMKKENLAKPPFQAVLEIIQSPEFKKELSGLGDYDLNETGKVISVP